MLDRHTDIVEAPDADARSLAFFAPRKTVNKLIQLRLAQLDPEVAKCGNEVVHKELLWVIWVTFCPKHGDKVIPLVRAHP